MRVWRWWLSKPEGPIPPRGILSGKRGGQPQACKISEQRVDSWCCWCSFLALLMTNWPYGPKLSPLQSEAFPASWHVPALGMGLLMRMGLQASPLPHCPLHPSPSQELNSCTVGGHALSLVSCLTTSLPSQVGAAGGTTWGWQWASSSCQRT